MWIFSYSFVMFFYLRLKRVIHFHETTKYNEDFLCKRALTAYEMVCNTFHVSCCRSVNGKRRNPVKVTAAL